MDHGSVYRRCGCRDENTGRLLGARCLGLRSPAHGSWYFSADLPSAAGQRRRVRRGGFATRAAAAAAVEALASLAAAPEPGLTTGEWLRRWLASRVSLRASTARSYAAHVRGYLVPYLGGIPLADLVRTSSSPRWLPPVRLHDLRHGAATLALAGNVRILTREAWHAMFTRCLEVDVASQGAGSSGPRQPGRGCRALPGRGR
jgi:hypothetical protein